MRVCDRERLKRCTRGRSWKVHRWDKNGIHFGSWSTLIHSVRTCVLAYCCSFNHFPSFLLCSASMFPPSLCSTVYIIPSFARYSFPFLFFLSFPPLPLSSSLEATAHPNTVSGPETMATEGESKRSLWLIDERCTANRWGMGRRDRCTPRAPHKYTINPPSTITSNSHLVRLMVW